MKKIFLGLSVVFASLFSAQYSQNNGWGNDGYNNGYYGDRDDSYYFPEDYYYEYPDDYYSDDYYRSYYNDYRRSISMINWERFFMQYQLTRMQMEMIMDLNRQFNSYYVWNNYYRMNPNRWYYDRFYALERILGPQVFIVFQNNYYNGYSPFTYYTNRWHNYYQPRFRVRPAYVNVNINLFRVNRNDYHRSVGNNYGWNQPRNQRTPGGFREDNGYRSNTNSSGYRNQNNTGLRTSGSSVRSNSESGMRNSGSSSVRSSSQSGVRTSTSRSGGFRNDSGTSSVRSSSPRVENRSATSVRSQPTGTRTMESNRSSNSGNTRSSGTRSSSSSRGSGGSMGGRR